MAAAKSRLLLIPNVSTLSSACAINSRPPTTCVPAINKQAAAAQITRLQDKLSRRLSHAGILSTRPVRPPIITSLPAARPRNYSQLPITRTSCRLPPDPTSSAQLKIPELTEPTPQVLLNVAQPPINARSRNVLLACGILAAAITLLPAGPAAAAITAVNTGDTAWVLTSTALVLFMTIPGLSLFYAGLVQEKNSINVLMKCFATTAIMTVLWATVGYTLSFSTSGNGLIGGLDKLFLANVTRASVHGTIPEALWFMFQMTFAIITPGLMIGALVERVKFASVLAFMTAWEILIYFPICHMVWGANGVLAAMGVMDFAGGIVVHVTAGISALLAAIMLGPRKDNKMVAHSIPMAVTGAGMLWVGWFGFNGGSAITAGVQASYAMMATQVSAAIACLVWAALDIRANGRTSVIGAITGAVAGLAAITPAAGFVGMSGAMAIGTISALVCRYMSTTIKAQYGAHDDISCIIRSGCRGRRQNCLLGTGACSNLPMAAFCTNSI
eukprot:jgi/Mesvir1/11954/Mv00281-RA.1